MNHSRSFCQAKSFYLGTVLHKVLIILNVTFLIQDRLLCLVGEPEERYIFFWPDDAL